MSWPSCLRLLVADVCIHVEVRAEAFLPWSELEQWSYGDAALAVFVGRVRVEGQNGISIDALEIEHYPGMCEARIVKDAEVALASHGANFVLVLHRVGRLIPGEVIVLVAVTADRRGPAQRCCSSLLEALKHEAPFWKREWSAEQGIWLEGNTPL